MQWRVFGHVHGVDVDEARLAFEVSVLTQQFYEFEGIILIHQMAAHDQARKTSFLLGVVDVCVILEQLLNNFCVELIHLVAANCKEEWRKHHTVKHELLVDVCAIIYVRARY